MGQWLRVVDGCFPREYELGHADLTPTIVVTWYVINAFLCVTIVDNC